MRWFVALAITALIMAGGYYVYQDPKVREVFAPSPPPRRPTVRSNPAETRQPPPPKSLGARSVGSNRPAAGSAKPAESREPQPTAESTKSGPVEGEPQISNEELSRVLFGILRAKQLAGGISLSVSEDVLAVQGTVFSEDRRAELIDILNRGRGRRALDVTQLRVE